MSDLFAESGRDFTRTVSVLLVEDDPDAAQFVRAELEEDPLLKVAPQHVATLRDALVAIDGSSFDAVLLDLSLPDASGTEAFDHLRRAAPELPLIVLSGSYDDALARHVLRQGAQDFLRKPKIDQGILSRAIQHAIERHTVATELKERRLELERSELRIRRIIEASVDAILIVDAEGVIRFANPAAGAMFDCPAEALVGEPFGYPLTAGPVTELDFHFRPGRVGVAEMRAVTLEWDGQPALLATLRDITERKRRNVELQLFRELVDRSSDAFEVLDPETGRFLDVNEKDCTDLGYSRADLLGLRVFDIDPSVDPARWPALVDGLRANGSMRGEGVHRRRDGTSYPIEFSARLVRLDRDYVVTVVRDITERKRTEAQLREQAALLDRTSDAIIVRDLDEVVRFWSKGAERVYGWTAAEAIGHSMVKRTTRNLPQRTAADAALRSAGEWTGELAQKRKDGREITVQCRWTLLRDDQGRPSSILSINSDVTEQKKLEAQFFRAQRLESIGTLASGIAHDLNNVLTPILLSLSSLKRDTAEPEALRTIELLEAAGKRGARLVQQVLAFGRGVDGERVTVQPLEIAQEIAGIIEDTFPPAITFELVAPRDPWSVTGDPTHLHQILMNLCVNARDAMPHGGRLTLKLEQANLDAAQVAGYPNVKPGAFVVLLVSDSGTGMSAEVRDRIFEPFFTTKELGRGTGLGLSTVLALAKAHQGFVSVDSEPGAGTTFRVYLPARPPARSEARKADDTTHPFKGRGETVMLVDDEEIIRAVASKILQKAGYQVILAANGSEAVARFTEEQGRVAAVLSDMSMPVMGGADTVAALKAIDPRVPVIGMSGRARAGATSYDGVKADRFLGKPFMSDVLLRTLREVIDARSAKPGP